MVLSRFDYCDFIDEPFLNKSGRDRIHKVQNICCRFVYGIAKYDPNSYKPKKCLKWKIEGNSIWVFPLLSSFKMGVFQENSLIPSPSCTIAVAPCNRIHLIIDLLLGMILNYNDELKNSIWIADI